MLPRAASYEELVSSFRWSVPERFNIGVACVDRWAATDPERPALLRYAEGGLAPVAYGILKRQSDALAEALRRRGVGQGDRVGLLLPQSAETVVGHLAVYKLGAVAVPLAALFGSDALGYRLAAARVKAVLTDAAGIAKLAVLRARLPGLATVISVDGPDGAADGYDDILAAFEGDFAAVDTRAEDPALMIFTSGTTGPPKGALHAHRVLIGHLPGFAFTHEFAPLAGDRLWTPSDWAWAGGLLNVLLPGLYFGIPVVFGPFRRFDPGEAFALMATAGVRNAFLPATALRLMRAVARPRERFDLNLRTIASAGESLGTEAYEWARATLGITVNEFYGQTECNYVLGSCALLGVGRAGTIGKAIPGHTVSIRDGDGDAVAPGTAGEIAIGRGDPSMFLGYFEDEAATRAKFSGDWMLTGDQAVADADGTVRFIGRNDDIITSAGYRIGPSEIEDCLAAHPAVALAVAVGKPDAVRTEIVKAFVVLKQGLTASPALADEIKQFVRTRLSAAEYPREIAFVDEIPLTTSGKVIRRRFREIASAEAQKTPTP